MCREFAAHTSSSLRPGYTAPFEEMSQRWRAVGNTVPDSTTPRFEPQTSRSRGECVAIRPIGPYSGNSRTCQLRNPFIFVTLTLKSSVNAVNSSFVVAGENVIFCCILVICCAVFEHIFDFYEVCCQIVKDTSVLAENFFDIQNISLNTNKQMRAI